MEHARRLFAVGLTILVLLAAVPAPAAAADVTLTVTVEPADGTSIKNGSVTATWNGDSSTSNLSASGKVLLDVPAGETVELTLSHAEYMRNSPVVIEDASTRDVTMTVHPQSEATVSVEDANGPVDGALVTLSQDRTAVVSERTDGGTIDTGAIEAGTYTLRVEKAEYYEVERTLEIPADGAIDHQVDLESGSVTLQVNVTDPYFEPPRPLEGITVTVEGQGSLKTQANGQQQLSVPVNSDLTVRFEGTAYETVEQSVESGEEPISLAVELDRANDLVVTVHTTQVVAGQPAFISVTDEYDDPVANATVLHNGESVTETDSEGWARIQIESTGTHEIQIDDGETISNVTEITAITASTEATSETTETAADGTAASTEPTDAPVPGFGPIVGLVGVVLGIGAGLFRRRSA